MVKSLAIGGQPSIEIIDLFSGEIFFSDQLTAKRIIAELFKQGHEIYISRK